MSQNFSATSSSKHPQSHHCKHTGKVSLNLKKMAEKQFSRFCSCPGASRTLEFDSAAGRGHRARKWKWWSHQLQNIQWGVIMSRLLLKYCYPRVNPTHMLQSSFLLENRFYFNSSISKSMFPKTFHSRNQQFLTELGSENFWTFLFFIQ